MGASGKRLTTSNKTRHFAQFAQIVWSSTHAGQEWNADFADKARMNADFFHTAQICGFHRYNLQGGE